MNKQDLNFFGDDPGAVKHGNFINYYSFHSVTQRIDNLHDHMFPSISNETILCLDIGCNTGELTGKLHEYMKSVYPHSKIYILAIDIDPTLIERAKESNESKEITYEVINIMDESKRLIIKEYLMKQNKLIFDFIFCFSVTMWIHLNNGDDGLHQFLCYLKIIASTIIIEPQPWNCYRNAQRRIKKSGGTFPQYETLKIRSDVDRFIQKVLSETTHKLLYESAQSKWNRKIQSYILVNS